MFEKRQYCRIKCGVGGTLKFRGTTYRCRIENLSLAGVLVNIGDARITDIRENDRCLLHLNNENEGWQITVEALIVRHLFGFVGLKFINPESETITSLETILERENHRTPEMSKDILYCDSYKESQLYPML